MMSEKVYSIHAGQQVFSIVPALGALGISLKMSAAGFVRELLFLPDDFWQQEKKQWRGGLPFCFPVCGRVSTGHMPLHGFAPYLPWEVTHHQADQITVSLHDTTETLRIYPYAFEVCITYRLTPTTFFIEQTYTNRGATPMPYYAGLHPYFLVQHPERTTLYFKSEKCFYYNATFTDIARECPPLPLPLTLDDARLEDALSEVHLPHEALLTYPENFSLHVVTEGDDPLFRYIQLYHDKKQNFFCVEPWMNQANALAYPERLHYLAPHQTERATTRIFLKTIT